jgi:hypothetical protein
VQRQLDWILGLNPYNTSIIVGFGYNQPRKFENKSAFYPPTPSIQGAVMNGLGGTLDDEPIKKEGSWQTAEIQTPHVAYAMWLMAELTKKE